MFSTLSLKNKKVIVMICINHYLSRSIYIIVLLAVVNHLHAQNVNLRFTPENIPGIPSAGSRPEVLILGDLIEATEERKGE